MDFPLDAEVHGTDGPCGRSTTVIVDPATEKVVYIAVRDTSQTHGVYLVPVDLVTSTTHDSIQLRCTCDELAKMEPFVETEYVEVWTPYYADELGYSYTGPELVQVEHQLVPSGTLAVNQGMMVEATDGARRIRGWRRPAKLAGSSFPKPPASPWHLSQHADAHTFKFLAPTDAVI